MSEEYHAPRIVSPHGLIDYQEGTLAQLKLYSIVREGFRPFTQSEVDSAKQIAQKMLNVSKVDTRLGLGFAILTDGFMNINFWGGKAPYLLNQNLYALDRKDIPTFSPDSLTRLDTDEEGVYCCFEGAILGHESEAWAKYITSREDESQKRRRYLEDFLSATVPRN